MRIMRRRCVTQTATTEDAKTYADEMMKRFKLVDMREQYSDIIAEAEANSIGYMDFLLRLLSVEEEGKMQDARKCCLKKRTLIHPLIIEGY